MADRKDEERKTPSWQLPKERQPETDAYHIWTPRPLLRSVYWKPDPLPPDDVAAPTYEIFIDQRAWTTMHEHVWQAEVEKTPFGYLIGDLCEDPNAGRRFVSITAALPARFDFDERASEQISREATLALQLEVERRRGVLAGWYHRHLGGDVELTEQDVETHLQHFKEPWQSALLFVGGGDRSEGGCFRVSSDAPDARQPVPFYEMASNESLLARGVKRSFVDWSNYTTVDEIRSEPRPRPTLEVPAPAPADPAPAAEEVEAGGAAGTPTESQSETLAETEIEPETEPEVELETEADGRPDDEEGLAAAEREEAPASEAETGEADPADATAAVAPPVQEAPRTEDGELDFDAIIDEVKAARIEFDESEVGDGPSMEEAESSEDPSIDEDAGGESDPGPAPAAERDTRADGPDWMRPEEEPVEAVDEAPLSAAGLTPAPEPTAGTASVPKQPVAPERGRDGGTERARLVGLVAIGLILLAAIAWGLVTVLGDGGDPADSGVVEPVRGSATDAGAEDPGAGDVPGVGDSLSPLPAATAAEVDSAGREMLATISTFYGQAVARDNGNATCDDLEAAYVAVENAWISYNNDFKGRFDGDLPDDLATRDERLYAGIQDAEVEYERSGCPRP